MDSKIMLFSQGDMFYPSIPTNNDLPFSYGLFRNCSISTPTTMRNYHEDLELVFFIKGHADVVCGEQVHHVQAGDVIVCNSYVPHQLVLTEDHMGYFALTIRSDFCKYNSIDVTSLWFTELIQDEQLNRLFYKFIDIIKLEVPYQRAALKLAVLDILVFLYRDYSRPHTITPPTKDAGWKYVYAAIQYIRENISKKLTVAEIAHAAGASEAHFMREFKRITGQTLTTYINYIRCENAETLLQNKKYKIKEVAALCGFENEAYFTKVFKKLVGQTPSEYVKAQQQSI